MAKPTGNKNGRPLKFEDPAKLDKLVDAYISKCKSDDEPLTITGLALYLGFCDKSSLYDYQKKEDFTHSIKRARSLVENGYEKRLGEGAGAIFALKNFGWTDRQDLNIGGQLGVTFNMAFGGKDVDN